jgi:putative ABC transport system permease protein
MINFFRRVWHLINRPRRERELLSEMRDHRASMPDPSRFGDTHRFIEQSRDAWGWNWLDDAAADFVVGIRTLRRSPSFAITATLILAFGIGINIALFQMMQIGMLRPPAIRNVDSVVRFLRAAPDSTSTAVPYPLTEFVKEHNNALSAVLVESSENVAWGRDAADRIGASFVSTNWFGELGYGAQEGRMFTDAVDGVDSTGGVPIVLGYTFWKNHLGAAPNLVGTTAYVDRKPVTIVGIAPAALPNLEGGVHDVYIPVRQREYFYPESKLLRDWSVSGVAMYGRLRDGMSPDAARESLRTTMQAASAERREVDKQEWLEPLRARDNFMRASDRTAVMAVVALLGALTGLVLVVAAANLGNLVMSRATGRVRELGVRMALGARRSRIVRQLMIESIPLVLLGTLGSLWFAKATVSVISAASNLPPYLDLSFDWRTVAAAAGLGSLSLIVVGLLPAWKVAQQHLMDAIKDGGQNVSRALDRTRLRRFMVAAQVAGSCLLLIVAGMTIRSVQRALENSTGFDYERVAVLSIPLDRYGITAEAARLYWLDVRDRARAHPEIESAAIVTSPPLYGRVFQTRYNDTPGLDTFVQSVEPEYFSVMRIPLLSGRNFAPGDAKTVIVSRRLAEAMYGTLDVLGQRFPKSVSEDDSDVNTIIGVANDAHSIKVEANNVTELYKPLIPEDFSEAFLVARARGNADLLPPILRAAGSLDSRVIPTSRVMREDFDRRMQGPRVTSAIAGGVGVLTLALACLGIFGVVSYGVALRAKEIGIRVALGAQQPALLRAIVRQVLTPVAAGVVVGLVLAIPVGIALHSDPFYLDGADPLAFATGLGVFATAGAIAALWPAYRVLRRNPIAALRQP